MPAVLGGVTGPARGGGAVCGGGTAAACGGGVRLLWLFTAAVLRLRLSAGLLAAGLRLLRLFAAAGLRLLEMVYKMFQKKVRKKGAI